MATPFASPLGTVWVVLNVDAPDWALTSVFQGAGAAMAALYLSTESDAPSQTPRISADPRAALRLRP